MNAPRSGTEDGELLRLGLLIVAGLSSFFVFAFGAARSGTFQEFESDIIPHALLTHGMLYDSWWTYSLWYPALRLLTAGGSSDQLMINGGFMLLGSLAMLRGVTVARLLVSSGYGYVGATVATGALVSCLALPTFGLSEYYYLGTLSPNSLGSATQLVSILFAVPAVYFLGRWFADPTRSNLIWVAASGALSALAKAGMTPAWIVGFTGLTVYLLFRRRIRWTAVLLVPLVVPGVSLLLSSTISLSRSEARGRIDPFAEWSALSDTIGVDLLRSWLFPLAVLVVCIVRLGRSTTVRLLAAPWSVATAALVQGVLLSDITTSGSIRGYGNFLSGAAVATSALYFMSVVAIVHLPVRFRVPLFALLGVQSIAGLVHVYNWTVTGSYF